MIGFIVSRAICVGATIAPFLQIVNAQPDEDTHLQKALVGTFLFGTWLFHRAIIVEREHIAAENEE